MRARHLLFGLTLVLALGPITTEAQTGGPNAPLELQAAEQWVNFGARWNAWSEDERRLYLEGMGEGYVRVGIALYAMRPELTDAQRTVLQVATNFVYDTSTMLAVVTDLYRDPSNTFIMSAAMVSIAGAKLDGKDIEPMLRLARQQDRASYKRSN
jgi:hypothetical protein